MSTGSVDVTEATSSTDARSGGPRPPHRTPLTLGLVLKIVSLGTINALTIWSLTRLIPEGVWLGVFFVVTATVAIDVVYLSRARWSIPYKYLLPGTIFLVVFQMYPVLYTAYISTTNLGTGNILEKDEAIDQVVATSVSATESETVFAAQVAQDDGGTLGMILAEESTDPPSLFIGTAEGLTAISVSDVTFDGDRVVEAADFTALTLGEAADFEQELAALEVPTDEGVIRLRTFTRAALVEYRLQYDEAADTMVDIETGDVYVPVDGYFTGEDGTQLTPGWTINVGFDNYRRVFESEAIRGPFLRVLVWNWVFATGTVLFGFALGLLLAIALNHPRLYGQRMYRAFLIFPWAIPSFLTVLVWQGMMNQNFGIINDITGWNTPWLTDPWMARVSVMIVSTWLTFPYFFVVSTGALQSIPDELTEAARVDGANGPQAFRTITLPLLLIAVAPLMIASFAFNFNNFNTIYMLNRGGPPIPGAETPAGSTDILITYTFRLAFESGRGQDLAFATAISILIFLHVALFSAWGFRKTARLEEI